MYIIHISSNPYLEPVHLTPRNCKLPALGLTWNSTRSRSFPPPFPLPKTHPQSLDTPLYNVTSASGPDYQILYRIISNCFTYEMIPHMRSHWITLLRVSNFVGVIPTPHPFFHSLSSSTTTSSEEQSPFVLFYAASSEGHK